MRSIGWATNTPEARHRHPTLIRHCIPELVYSIAPHVIFRQCTFRDHDHAVWYWSLAVDNGACDLARSPFHIRKVFSNVPGLRALGSRQPRVLCRYLVIPCDSYSKQPLGFSNYCTLENIPCPAAARSHNHDISLLLEVCSRARAHNENRASVLASSTTARILTRDFPLGIGPVYCAFPGRFGTGSHCRHGFPLSASALEGTSTMHLIYFNKIHFGGYPI
jgi:hypothetical protein